MRGRTLSICILTVFLISPAIAQSPGAGETIWEWNFSNGMPDEFQKDASYVNSGTWGCEWPDDCEGTDTSGAYEPASISNGWLRVKGQQETGYGYAFPKHLTRGIENWEFLYKVKQSPYGSHENRPTGGMSTDSDFKYNSRNSGKNPGIYWEDLGDTLVFNGKNDYVTFSDNMDVDKTHYVRVASQPEKTYMTYWEKGEEEPDDWMYEVDVDITGRPGFFAYASYHDNRYNYYKFYQLKNITTEKTLCDSRGPFNECISSSRHDISGEKFNITSIFQSEKTAIFNSLNSPARVNISNSSRISGLWKGSFTIFSNSAQITPGADFRPEDGRIIIGK